MEQSSEINIVTDSLGLQNLVQSLNLSTISEGVEVKCLDSLSYSYDFSLGLVGADRLDNSSYVCTSSNH